MTSIAPALVDKAGRAEFPSKLTVPLKPFLVNLRL